MDTLLALNWRVMLPEFIILGFATILAIADLFFPKEKGRQWFGYFGALGIVSAIVSLVLLLDTSVSSLLFETFYLDSFAKGFKLILLVAGLFVLILATGSSERAGMEGYRSEFYYLLLVALLGGMIVTSSADLITLFIGLELVSICSYILVGLRKRNTYSNEAAMKYVINGGIATALVLFGFSYLYGFSGTTNLMEMGEHLFSIKEASHLYMLVVAFAFIIVGLSFKMATVPFHAWAPDVYQGASTIVTMFLSVVSKLIGFAFFIRLMYAVFARVQVKSGYESLLLSYQSLIIGLAIVTMVVGNIMAIRQKNIKRLFAYSSIAHAGYLLAGFVSFSRMSFDAVWFYLLAYLFMNVGAFAIIYYVTKKEETADIQHFAGLYKRSPVLAVMMSVFLLSLASIPGTAGFIGKIKIIMSALMVNDAHYVLAAFIIGTTVISYVYYFGIMMQLFFHPAKNEQKLPVNYTYMTIITICTVAVFWLGLFPNTIIEFFHSSFNGFSDFLR